MELSVGMMISGKVTTITKFGAFVALPDGKSGLVHISEVSNSFVSDVHDFLETGQEVQVKVLSITPDGKINLSIKQTQTSQPRQNHIRHYSNGGNRSAQMQNRPNRRPAAAAANTPPAEPSFEDKLKKFMSASDSKMSELNRHMEGRRRRK